MDKMIRMKEMLMSCIETQMGHLDTVDAKELGEVIDMVKDLSEAIYYCTITKAMEEKEGQQQGKEYHYYTERIMPERYREEDEWGKMYYSSSNGSNGTSNGSSNGYSNGARGSGNTTYGAMKAGGGARGYTEYELPMMMRDEREGKSHMSRKMYMESKQMHQDKNVKLKDLEKYLQELSSDISEMIEGASPEEKQLLEKRLISLGNKIGQMNG